jgi:2-keto-4-pentenoate hydratase/2-oxohepta-3-ene-1,7-dioic acid hydratase in catechol pathway
VLSVQLRSDAKSSQTVCVLPGAGWWTDPGLTLAALKPGDRVEVQVEDIGVLTNEVVAEPAR